MKRMLMAIMAVAVAVAFSAPSFAEEGKKKGKDKKDAPKLVQMIYADDEKGEKKDEEKGGKAEEGKKKKKDEEKGK
jgi:hypothetical protein